MNDARVRFADIDDAWRLYREFMLRDGIPAIAVVDALTVWRTGYIAEGAPT